MNGFSYSNLWKTNQLSQDIEYARNILKNMTGNWTQSLIQQGKLKIVKKFNLVNEFSQPRHKILLTVLNKTERKFSLFNFHWKKGQFINIMHFANFLLKTLL